MAQLPAIVRRHLQNTSSPACHPDAALLTGFAEHALTAALRTQVLHHLLKCGDCRSLIAIAAPKPRLESSVQIRLVPQRKLSWAKLVWASVGVGALLIATAIRIPPNSVMQQTPPLDHDRIAVIQQSVEPAIRAPKAIDSYGPQPPARTRGRRALAQHRQELGTAKIAAPAAGPDYKVGYAAATASTPPGEAERLMVLNGFLYRGIDDRNGFRWQPVDMQTSGNFCCVAVRGNDVWAVGNDGVVFRSVNGGQQWTRLAELPRDASQSLGITEITFDDPLRGTIRTAAHTNWVTEDGGFSWRKQ